MGKKLENICCCGRQAASGKQKCIECAEKARLESQRRRDLAKENEICQKCGQLTRQRKLLCLECSIKVAEQRNKERLNRINAGLCQVCGKQSVAKGKKVCQFHLDEQNRRNKERRQLWRDSGLCETCGKEPIITATRRKTGVGEICYLKQTASLRLNDRKRWKDLRMLFDRQNICPFLKIELTLGVNTSLDHKTPRSRGGTNDIENLQWVYCDGFFDINSMKWELTNEEFNSIITMLKNVDNDQK